MTMFARLLMGVVVSLVLVSAAGAQTATERIDQGLMIGGISMSSIALGITMSCTSAGTCRELNPVMGKWIGESAVKASVVKSTLTGISYYAIWRLTKGKTRTLTLLALTAFNTFDAVHDVRQMRSR